MINKIVSLWLVFLIFHAGLYADWKVDVCSFFGQTNDYQQAVNYLLSHLEKISETDKPLVYILLAYSYEKLADENNEYKWLGAYFEKCRGYRPLFNFLEEYTSAAAINYIRSWEERFPLITEVALLDSRIYDKPAPPEKLIMAVHMANDAYYRLSKGKSIISGGTLKKGLNVISFETDHLFEQSGKHTYFLDVKADDLVLRKEIEVDVQLKAPTAEKRIEFRTKGEKTDNKVKNIEYKLSMFVGDKLIVTSKKIQPYKLELKLDLPLTKGKFQPFGPVVDKSDPFTADPLANSFSILNAVAGITQLLKGIGKKGAEGKKLPPPQERKQIEINFIRKNPQGIEEKVNAVLKLGAKTLEVFSYK